MTRTEKLAIMHNLYGKNTEGVFKGTYRIFCKNGFNSFNRYDVKDLFKAMTELANIFNNDIKMGILFEVED